VVSKEVVITGEVKKISSEKTDMQINTNTMMNQINVPVPSVFFFLLNRLN